MSDEEFSNDAIDEVDEKDSTSELNGKGGKIGTRSKTKSKKPKKENGITMPSSIRKMFVVHKKIGEHGWKNVESVSLPHPRTENMSLFLLVTNKNKKGGNECLIYECLTFTQPTRSWFVDESVVSDGNLHISTPIDPLFLLLPHLAKSTQGKRISDLLTDLFPPKAAEVFATKIPVNQLEKIALRKVIGDVEAYVYSEDRALSWLTEKVKSIERFLADKGINGGEASISSNFTKSSSGGEKGVDLEFLRYAVDIVGEYLTDDLRNKLCISLHLPVETQTAKRKNEDESPKESRKRGKVEKNGVVTPLEDYGSNAASPPALQPKGGKAKAKETELKKAAQGTPSLFKFFSARPSK